MGKKKKECDDSPEHSCRKHAGLPKSDDSSRNNNRVSLRSLRVGKRRITEVTRVASGASVTLPVWWFQTARVVKKRGGNVTLFDANERIGVIGDGKIPTDGPVWVLSARFGPLRVVSAPAAEILAFTAPEAPAQAEKFRFPVDFCGIARARAQSSGTRLRSTDSLVPCVSLALPEDKPIWFDATLVSDPQGFSLPSSAPRLPSPAFYEGERDAEEGEADEEQTPAPQPLPQTPIPQTPVTAAAAATPIVEPTLAPPLLVEQSETLSLIWSLPANPFDAPFFLTPINGQMGTAFNQSVDTDYY